MIDGGHNVGSLSGAAGEIALERDASWDAEVRLETVRAVAARERLVLPANLFGVVMCLIAAWPLSVFWAICAALTWRLVSITVTRILFDRLRAAIDERRSYVMEMRLVTAAMVFAGIGWGLVLWPINEVQYFGPSMIALRGVVIVGVALVTVTLGAMLTQMFTFVGSFTLTVVIGLVTARSGVSPWAAIPLLGIVVGIVVFGINAAKQQIEAADTLVRNRRLGEELAEALGHAEFLSRRDPLTGLLNRRAFFEESLDPADPAAPRHLLAIDLDHFKRINDHHGHAVGDRVLVATADAMRAITRALPFGEHRAVRLGGEEFVLLLEGLDRAAAAAVAEALRCRIARIGEDAAQDDLTVSASIGLSEFRSGDDVDAVLRRSDLAMYRAKDRGRNQVVQEAA